MIYEIVVEVSHLVKRRTGSYRLRHACIVAPFPLAPESMICIPGRSAADGRLANPVRSGRKQPQ